MIEAYRIGVTLVANTSGVTGPLDALIAQFERLLKIQKQVQTALNNLASGTHGAVSEASALATAWERVERAARAASTATTGGTHAAGGPRRLPVLLPDERDEPRRTFTGGVSAGGALVPHEGSPRGPIPLGSPGGLPAVPFSGALMTAAVAYAGARAVERAMAAGFTVEDEKAALRQQGATESQIAQVYRRAMQVQRDVPGVTVAELMREILDFAMLGRNPKTGAIGLDAAMIAANDLGKTGFVMGGMQKLFQGEQAAELKGALINEKTGQIDLGRFRHFLHIVEQINLITGGRIDAGGVLNFVRNSGIGGMILKDDAIIPLLPIMLSMNPRRAGTGIQALAQQFGAGKMNKAALNLLTQMGIITDPRKVIPYGVGQYQLLPGAMPITTQQALKNPVDFVERILLPAMERWSATHHEGTSLTTQALVSQMISSRIPGANALADIIRLLPLAHSYEAAYEKSKNRDPYAIAMTAPSAHLVSFMAAFNAFLVTLSEAHMGQAVAVLDGATKFFSWVAKSEEEGIAAKRGAQNGAGGIYHFWEHNPLNRRFWFAPEPGDPDFQRQSYAPTGDWHDNVVPISARWQAVPVVVVNGRDIADGVTGHLTRELSRPPSGRTDYDYRVSPLHPGATPNV